MSKPSAYLAVELAGRNKNGLYDKVIERAANNGYHDYKFDQVPDHPEYGQCTCPKMQLAQDLSMFPELEDVRQDVINGVYDDEPDAADGQRLRDELLKDGAPDPLFSMMGMEVPTEEERLKYGLK